MGLLSRFFKGAGEKAVRPHLLRGRGRGGEIADLRNDTEGAFLRVQQEMDILAAESSANGNKFWKDLQRPIEMGSGAAALVYELYASSPFKMYFFSHNQDDVLYFTHQMQHDWEVGTDVYPHMHVYPMANGAGDVVLDGYYAWSRVGVSLPTTMAGWTYFKVARAFTADDQYDENVIGWGPITPPEWASESSHLLTYIRRPGASDVDDTYSTNKVGGTVTANLGLMSADVHYQLGKLGTVDQYPA